LQSVAVHTGRNSVLVAPGCWRVLEPVTLLISRSSTVNSFLL